jgi:hypothetical protein
VFTFTASTAFVQRTRNATASSSDRTGTNDKVSGEYELQIKRSLTNFWYYTKELRKITIRLGTPVCVEI